MPEPAPPAGRLAPVLEGSPATPGTSSSTPSIESPAPSTPAPSAPTPSSLRRAIVLHLRQAGPTSPDGLAAALGASRTGVLQQLHALEDAKLVSHAPERHGVGRPRHLYDVTPDAQALFPSDYDGFARGILAAIVDIGGEDLLEQVFAARRRQMGARLREKLDGALGPDVALEDRVRELAVIQDAGGYLAEAFLGEDGSMRLREHNCAVFRLARESRSCCDAEIQLFRDILGAEVVRETHIAAGDRSCTYRISESLAD